MKTLVLKIDPKRPGREAIIESARVIRKGGLVAFPTETVYGLGANILNRQAIKRLYDVKKRPKAKPLAIHISSLSMIRRMGCTMTSQAKALIDKFWPGPLTIILKSEDGESIGFRMPDNKVALDLIDASRVPIAAPSANLSGRPAPRSGGDVLKDLDGNIDILLDAGKTDIGVESTVIDLTVAPPKILREGAIKRNELAKIISRLWVQ